MTIAFTIQLFSLDTLLRLDIMAWVIGLPLVVGAILALVSQYRQYRELEGELALLKKQKRHSIEYEMVMKVMKLSIWRVDVPTRTVTFESDYREHSDNLLPPPGTPVETICNQLMPEYVDIVKKGMADLMAGRTDDYHLQYQVRVPHSDRTYWAESYATIDKRDVDGKPLSLVGTTRRIDQQKEIENALMDALYHAEESDRLKSAFLANISHEIRTPLNAIVGFSDILGMVETEEERNELLALIKKNNKHLLHLFDSMVRMSRLEARGGDTVKKTTFPLTPLLFEVVTQYDDESKEKGIPVVVNESEVGLTLTTDRDRLREILGQYVDNALKFTEQGSVSIETERRDRRLRIIVADTGKGIPADKCNEHLFERFVKVDDFIPGTGLGLSICRSMAMTLGGEVGVESELGKGSRFWVELNIEG